MRAKARAASRSKKGFFAESPRERFFTPAASLRPSSATVNACSPSCRTLASAISVRSCGRNIAASKDGSRGSKEGRLRMVAHGALCVPLTPRTLDDVFSADVSGADFVEVRLDYLDKPRD